MDYTVFFLPTLLILLGILALKLPRKYNPFQLKRAYARHVSEDTQNTLPKVIGWVLLGIGALWLLGIVALFLLFKFADGRNSNQAEDTARQNVAKERKVVDDLNQLIQSSNSYSVLSKNGGRYTISVKEETRRLNDLKSACQLTPRENLSQAYFLTPNLVVDFHKDGKKVVQLKLSVSKTETALNAVNALASDNADSTLDQKSTSTLIEILGEHEEKNLQRILNSITKPDRGPTRP